jgi:hypothetical protein
MNDIQAKWSCHCDICGASVAKVTRRYKGESYCLSCYGRFFKPVPCCGCGNRTRGYVGDIHPICSNCRRLDSLCFRCERPVKKVGRIIDDKVICNSCSPHFRTPRPCSRCGILDSKLSKIPGTIGTPVCGRCRRKLTYATCHRCGKNRPFRNNDLPAKPLCRQCIDSPSSSFKCSKCGKLVPGNSGKFCRDCRITDSIYRKSNQLEPMFRIPEIRMIWSEYAEWLVRTGRGLKALGRISKDSDFLMRLENGLSTGTNPMEIDLKFTPEDIRRNGFISMFLKEKGVLQHNNLDRGVQAAELASSKILMKSEAFPFRNELVSYANSLRAKVPALKARTIKIYINVAYELFFHSGVESAAKLERSHLQAFLWNRPGRVASLYPFISYFGIASKFRSIRLPRRRRRENTVSNGRFLGLLLRWTETDITEKQRRSAFAKVLSLTYGMPLEDALKLKYNEIRQQESNVQILINGRWVPIENEIIRRFNGYFEINSRPPGDLLFRGRMVGDSLSSSAVRYHLKYIYELSRQLPVHGKNPF